MKLSETLQQVIALGEVIGDYWDRELPKRFRDYPFVHPGEDAGPPPPEEEQFKKLLDSLPDEELFKILLIEEIGRGKYGTDDLARHYQEVKDEWVNREQVLTWLTDRPPLTGTLVDGLEELRKKHIDVDALLSTPSESRA